MEKKPRLKMSRADRAKQFAPFSALKPLEEELDKKEKAQSDKKKAENRGVSK